MKKLDLPTFDRKTIRLLRSELADVSIAQKLWKRGYGKYRNFKESVTKTMKIAQSNRCAYCGARLHEKRPHRDHIAPKSPHFKWTFWPANLVLACYCCNVDCKGEIDTVDVLARSYRRSTFKIVHPFFDDPAAHLDYGLDKKSILVSAKNGSAKGARTIELFNLMDPERAKQRAKDLLFDDDVDHLQGITRDMFLAATKDLDAGRLTMKMSN
jgi:uncharacterized protein (TIGR02646 family)